MRILASYSLILLLAGNIFPCTVSIYDIKTNAVFGKVVAEWKERGILETIPNATIQIYKNKEDGIEIIAETKSDENGRFEIKDFPAGKYMIRASAGNFLYSYAFMKLKNSSKKNRDKEIVFFLVGLGECSGKVEIQKIPKTK